jgi:hypothetical protein
LKKAVDVTHLNLSSHNVSLSFKHHDYFPFYALFILYSNFIMSVLDNSFDTVDSGSVFESDEVSNDETNSNKRKVDEFLLEGDESLDGLETEVKPKANSSQSIPPIPKSYDMSAAESMMN